MNAQKGDERMKISVTQEEQALLVALRAADVCPSNMVLWYIQGKNASGTVSEIQKEVDLYEAEVLKKSYYEAGGSGIL